MPPRKPKANDDDINVYEKSKGIIIDGEDLEDINAEIVKMSGSCAQNINSKNSARIEQSCIKHLITNTCDAKNMVISRVTSEISKFSNSFVGVNESQETVSEKTICGVSMSDTVHATSQNSLISVSTNTNASEIKSVLFVGKNVTGSVNTLFTGKTAAIFGIAAGAVLFGLSAIFHEE